MHAVDVVRRLHQHRVWVTHRLLTAAQTIPPKDLKRPLEIGQGSLWKSLVHMYAAEWVWLETLLGEENPILPGDVRGKLPGNQEGTGAIGSFADLVTLWQQLDERWQAYLDNVSDADLDPLVYKVTSRGDRIAARRGDILLHVCTHAHYTAAQTINMLRQLGGTPLPDPMLISLARAELAKD